MKTIKYKLCVSRINQGTAENPNFEDVLSDVEIECKTEDAYQRNLLVAKSEAYNGEYTVEDDGQPEPDNASTDDVLNTLLGVSV